MHDPMVVAFEIRRPVPRLRRRDALYQGRRVALRHGWAKWYKPWQGWSCFWRFGRWEAYFPGLLTVWHVEPRGRDSGEVCKHHKSWQDAEGRWHSKRLRAWRWHLSHWHLQFAPWQHLRRWALTRCEWCHGRSKRGDRVNVSQQWDRSPSTWWKGERGLFHQDCSAIAHAHHMCTCQEGLTDPRPGVYTCLRCDKLRRWDQDGDRSPRDITNRILSSIPTGGRDPHKHEQVAAMWRDYRHATEEDGAA